MMKSLRNTCPLSAALVVSLVGLSALLALAEQPSTVFVLDTSDSDSASPNNGAADPAASESNTRIISDETNTPAKISEKHNQTSHQRHETAAQSGNHHQQHQEKHATSTAHPSTTANANHQHHEKQATGNHSQHHEKHDGSQSSTVAPSNHHNHQQGQQQQQHHEKHVTKTTQDHHEQHHDQNHEHQNHQGHNQVVTSRRLEEPVHASPVHKVSNQQQHHANNHQANTSTQQHHSQQNSAQQQEHTSHQSQHQQHQPSNQKHGDQKSHKPTSTSTTTSRPNETDQGASGPKTEERLLISISSEDPDEPYKKVSTGGGGGGGGSSNYEETASLVSSGNSQAVHHHQKRKPSITISIQDANISKQNGGSGTQAVIVRPGEDGQSIVIATVGAASISNSQKYKPAGQASSSENEGISVPIVTNQQRPYNEPINNPIQSIIAQHQITSTTRRPPIGSDYSGQSSSGSQNRPITSSLIDQQRPSIQLIDERPQRPIQGGLDDRPNGVPAARPNSDSYTGGDNDQSTNSGDQYSGLGDEQQQRKYPLDEKNCGIMHETRIVGGEEADPDDFMWMAAIIKSRPNNGEPRPFCGGSLITRRHVLTAAHCLEGLAPRDVLVRLGSYDFEDSASSSSADYAIDQFRVPAQYSKKTHVADLAIMRLKTPLSTSDQYKTVCMPQPRRSYVGAFGLVTGYGSQSQTFRKAAPKLRQVTVPIWENRKCSKVYNKTMGDSFLCAGYEEGGKDACQGDSGGPIMTEGPDQKMMIVGVVSHGIGCGSPGYPGVYTRTSTFADWIEKNTRE